MDLPPFVRKEVFRMRRNNAKQRYYSYRLKLEKLKQTTAILVVIARVLLFLVAVIHLCW